LPTICAHSSNVSIVGHDRAPCLKIPRGEIVAWEAGGRRLDARIALHIAKLHASHMTRATTLQSFSQLALAEFGTIPRRELLQLAAGGAAVAASSLIFWSHKPDVLPIDYAMSAALLLGWGALLYAVSMKLMGSRLSMTGFIRFSATSLVMMLPAPILLALLWLSAIYKIGPGIALSGVLFVAWLIFMMLLPAWPILQATSAKFIGPLTAIRATRGIRWPLVMAGFLTAGLNRAIPKASSAMDVWSALILAILDGAIAIFFAMLAISIGVAAAKLMLAKN